MKRMLGTALLAGAIGLATCVGLTRPAMTEDMSNQAYQDIEKSLGSVPLMFKAMPKNGVAGAWEEFKSMQLGKDTALDPKTKELMGLAVSAQIPCQYCIYFHTAAAKANGATEEEIREAVAMAAIVRHWSTVLNGMQVDEAAFRSEVDAMMKGAADATKTGSTTE